MQRSSALGVKLEHDTFTLGSGPNYAHPTVDNSTYFLHNHNSDSESISDESRKIRKKRDVYNKISDDIRVGLLEAVQNGETLKSAAKRYKINYSSAKSILHTYRKEGRILKKSAQERTTKKKGTYEDSESAPQVTKSSKKEHAKNVENILKTVAPLAERTVSASTCASYNNESSVQGSSNSLTTNYMANLKMEHNGNHQDDHKALVRPPVYHMNYSDFNFPEVGGDFHRNETVEFPTNMYFSSEFDQFNDMMGALQPRHPKNEEAFHDPNAFFYPKGFNNGYHFEEHAGKPEAGANYEENLENAGNYTLKSFMDTQKLLQEALTKNNFWNVSGSQGFRKSSFDLF
jgi:hypothetical protein